MVKPHTFNMSECRFESCRGYVKIKFTEYLYPEDYNFTRIVREAGYSHEVDGEEVLENVWNGGTRELAVELELDTDTGIIVVVGQ